MESLGYDITPSGIEPFGYDALWAIALTLNRSVETLAKEDRLLEQFSYDNEIIGKVLFNEMNSTKFSGLTVNTLRCTHSLHCAYLVNISLPLTRVVKF